MQRKNLQWLSIVCSVLIESKRQNLGDEEKQRGNVERKENPGALLACASPKTPRQRSTFI